MELITNRSATSEEVANITKAAEERFSRVGTSPADLHGMWYPTVRRTLMCLFKLYRCVDRSIFQVPPGILCVYTLCNFYAVRFYLF